MDHIELQVNGKPLIFTSKSVAYGGHVFFYSKMSNISHRSGDQPEYLFDYDGKRLEIPYDPKDKKITLKIFQQVVAMEQKSNAARSPYLAKEEPVAPAGEKHYKPYWLAAVVAALFILVLAVIYVRSSSDSDDIKEADINIAAEQSIPKKSGSTSTATGKAIPKKEKKISLDNNEGTLTYIKCEVTKDYDGNPAALIFFEYTNKRSKTSTALTTFYPQVFQNGVECETASSADDTIKDLDNASKEIQKGTTIKIAYIFSLQDLKNPITLKVTDMSDENLLEDIYQEQEITLK